MTPEQQKLVDSKLYTKRPASEPPVSSTGWLGIESAPTDGTLFIGINGTHVAPTKRGKYYVKWPHEEGVPTYEERWNEVQPDHIAPWNPTHWMPMPNSPINTNYA